MKISQHRHDSWIDPSTGSVVLIEDIVALIRSNHKRTVHVGTDSHRFKGPNNKDTYVFATVICIYEIGKGADYYFKKDIRHMMGKDLRQRIVDEVTCSIDVSLELMEHDLANQIIVHADINSDANHKTFRYLNQIRSWILSTGLDFRCKPNAWASSGVADRHAK